MNDISHPQAHIKTTPPRLRTVRAEARTLVDGIIRVSLHANGILFYSDGKEIYAARRPFDGIVHPDVSRSHGRESRRHSLSEGTAAPSLAESVLRGFVKTGKAVRRHTLPAALSLLLVLSQSVLGLTAFEAHVINVTAKIEPLDCTPVGFSYDANGNQILAGQQIDNEYKPWGLTVMATNNRTAGPPIAIAFDSANPTGGDTDLGTPHEDFGGPGIGDGGKAGEPGENKQKQRSVLIIAENNIDANNDGLVDDPDDEETGGELRFLFDSETNVKSIRVFDVEVFGGQIILFDNNYNSTAIPIPVLGDNSAQTITLDAQNVREMRVTLSGSGAVDDMCFDPVEPTPEIPGCPFTPKEGRIIVPFSGKTIRSNGTEADATEGPVPATIPAGNYAVSLASFDNHSGSGEGTQSNESWYLIFENGVQLPIASTTPISDLSDGDDLISEQVAGNFTLAETAAALTAFHATYPDAASSNTVVPLCVALDSASPQTCDARSQGYWKNSEGCQRGEGESIWENEVQTLSITFSGLFATTTGADMCVDLWTPNCPSGNTTQARLCKAKAHTLADELNVVSGKLALAARIAGADNGVSAFDNLELDRNSTVGEALAKIEMVLIDSASSGALITDAGYVARRIYLFYEYENPFAPRCIFTEKEVNECKDSTAENSYASSYGDDYEEEYEDTISDREREPRAPQDSRDSRAPGISLDSEAYATSSDSISTTTPEIPPQPTREIESIFDPEINLDIASSTDEGGVAEESTAVNAPEEHTEDSSVETGTLQNGTEESVSYEEGPEAKTEEIREGEGETE